MKQFACILLLILGGSAAAETITFYPGTARQIAVTFTYQSGTGSWGRFVCPNDVWVADNAGGYITITGMTPKPADPCRVFCDLNPDSGYTVNPQGLAGHIANYSTTEDIIDTGFPVNIAANNSAVFGMEHNGAPTHYLNSVAILTVLSAAPSPPTDGYWFRPYWGATSKTPEYNTGQLNMDVFADKASVTGTPTWATCQGYFRDLVFDWQWNSLMQSTHWYPNFPLYDTWGGYLSLRTTDAVMKLCENATDSEKLVLAKYLLQYGLDVSRQIQYTDTKGIPFPVSPNYWYSAGGFACGRFLPVVAVARALNDATAQGQIAHAGTPYINTLPYDAATIFFGEPYQGLRYVASDIKAPPYNYTVPDAMHCNTSISVTGTVTFTNGSTAVVGSGTNFGSWAGKMIMCKPNPDTHPSSFSDGYQMDRADGRAYTIASVTDTTHLTLTGNWLGTTGSYSYGVATFVGLNNCNRATSPYKDLNEPTTDWIGCPAFFQGGRTEWYLPGIAFNIIYENNGWGAAHGYVMGLLMMGGHGLGGFDDYLDYGDSYAYQIGAGTLGGYGKDWYRNIYNAYRADYAATHPQFKNVQPNAGNDREINQADRYTVQLDGTASKDFMLDKTTTNYLWKEGGSTITTGIYPDTIALSTGIHTITLEETDVHDSKTESDTVVLTVLGDAATYYVDSATSEGGNGSLATPWDDLSDITGLAPGDSVLLKAGSLWREALTIATAGAAGSPITIGVYGTGATPIINGSKLVTGWTVHGGNQWEAALTTAPTQVYFNNTLGKKELTLAAVNAQYDWFWEANLLYTYATSDPDTLYTSPGSEASIYPASTADGLLRTTKGYVNFTDIAVTKSAGRGIEVEAGTGNVIHGCKVDWAYGGGIVIPLSTPLTANITVEECEVCYTQTCAFNGEENHEGLTFEKTSGFTCRRNHVHHNYHEGIDAKYGATDGDIYQNLCHDNGHTDGTSYWNNIIQIYLDGCSDVNVFNNYVYGGSAFPYKDIVQGIDISMEQDAYPTTNIRVFGNVIRDCGDGMKWWVASAPTGDMSGLYIVNNTFYSCADNGINVDSAVTGHLAATIQIKNNIFWQDAGSAITDSTTGNEMIGLATISYNGFCTGQASETKGTNYVETATPGFADPSVYNFALTSPSPFRNAGTDTGTPFYTGLTAGSTWPTGVTVSDQRAFTPWEIGAYVWTGIDTLIFEFYPAAPYRIKVTWKYNSTGTMGTFVCANDFWAADTSGITIMDVDPLPSDPCNIHADVDPYVGVAPSQGLSPHCANYSAAEDIIDTLNPADSGTWVNVAAGHSIVFLLEYSQERDLTWAKAAAVLTVLSTAPPSGSFRPPWTGSDKTISYDTGDINYAVFASLTEPAGAPSFSTCEGWFEKPVLDWALEPADYPHGMPRENLPRTGKDLATRVNVASLKLNCNFTNAEKQNLAACLIQYGIDVWGILNNNNGGHRGWVKSDTIDLADWYEGRLVAAAVAAQALNHTALKAMLAKTGDYIWSGSVTPADAWYFAEACQTHLVTSAEATAAGVSQQWVDCPDFASVGRRAPTYSGPGYPKTNELAAEPFVSAAMNLYLLGATGIGDFDALLDYADYRWQLCGGQFTQQVGYGDWQEEFYDHHRADYAATHRYCYLLWPDAGANQQVPYEQRTSIQLTAAASKNWHPAQTSTTYTWKEGANTIATGQTPVVSLTPGIHNLSMELRDVESSDMRTDTVTITVGESPARQWLMIRN